MKRASDRIKIRKPKVEDIPTIYNLTHNTSDSNDFLSPSIITYEEMEKNFKNKGFWEDYDGIPFMIEENTGKLIGEIIAFKSIVSKDGYELSYHIYRKEDRKKGYMSAALEKVTEKIFMENMVQKLYILADEKNKASWSVAEKCGFRHIETKLQPVFHQGEYRKIKTYLLKKG